MITIVHCSDTNHNMNGLGVWWTTQLIPLIDALQGLSIFEAVMLHSFKSALIILHLLQGLQIYREVLRAHFRIILCQSCTCIRLCLNLLVWLVLLVARISQVRWTHAENISTMGMVAWASCMGYADDRVVSRTNSCWLGEQSPMVCIQLHACGYNDSHGLLHQVLCHFADNNF